MSRFLCALLPLLVLSCADSGGPVAVDAQWNLSCPSSGVGCGSWAQETCIGNGGQREIVAEHGQAACDGDQIIARCVAVDQSDGTRKLTLEANIGDRFAFELRGATVDSGGSVEQTACNVTIIEDEVPYDVGACGQEPPSVDQPCQLSNISVEGSEVIFGLECDSLLSSVTDLGLDVGALGGGPTPIRFANCSGF
ncbi:MAG: hypothetical protein JSU89_02100 [Myxococcales bacterium]|nr:MAG: hypothetical protein JSU89_02100 [Myxococcales bacterium]